MLKHGFLWRGFGAGKGPPGVGTKRDYLFFNGAASPINFFFFFWIWPCGGGWCEPPFGKNGEGGSGFSLGGPPTNPFGVVNFFKNLY